MPGTVAGPSPSGSAPSGAGESQGSGERPGSADGSGSSDAMDSVWSVFKDVEAQGSGGAMPDGPVLEGTNTGSAPGGTAGSGAEPAGSTADGSATQPGGTGTGTVAGPGTGSGTDGPEDDGWIKRDRGSAGGASAYEQVYAPQAPGAEASATSPSDAVGSLEAELERALETFDGMILDQRGPVLAQGDRLPEPSAPEEGGAAGGGNPQAAVEPSRRAAPPPPDQPRGGRGGGGNVPEDGPAGGPAEPIEVPEEFADAKDDDVIARQLREAAMTEQDPALREKLWEEYRRYKAGA
jgi:hypothetical protein